MVSALLQLLSLCTLLIIWPVDSFAKSQQSQASKQLNAAALNEAETLFKLHFQGLESPQLNKRWAALGYQLEEQSDRWLLTPMPKHSSAHAKLVFAKQPSTNVILQAPHGFSDRYSANITQQLFDQGGFNASMTNTQHRKKLDLAHTHNSVLMAFTRAAQKQLKPLTIIQIHGFAQEKRRSIKAKNAQIILSTGYRRHDERLGEIAQCLKKTWPQTLIFPEQVNELGGTKNVIPQQLDNPTSSPFIHVELNFSVRQQLIKEPLSIQALQQCLLIDEKKNLGPLIIEDQDSIATMLQEKYEHKVEQDFFWRNLGNTAKWWPYNKTDFRFSQGWLYHIIDKDQGALIKVPPLSPILLLTSEDEKHQFSAYWSEGDGLFVKGQWLDNGSHNQKIIFNDSPNIRYLKINISAQNNAFDNETEKDISAALFVGEKYKATWLNYRQNVNTDGISKKLTSHPGNRQSTVYPLSANNTLTLSLQGPTRLHIQSRLSYPPNSDENLRQYQLRFTLDDHKSMVKKLQTTMDHRYSYNIDDDPKILSLAQDNWINIAEGEHSLKLEIDQDSYLEIYQVQDSNFLLPSVNGLKPNSNDLIKQSIKHSTSIITSPLKQSTAIKDIPIAQKEQWKKHFRDQQHLWRYKDIPAQLDKGKGQSNTVKYQAYSNKNEAQRWYPWQDKVFTQGQRTKYARQQKPALFTSLQTGSKGLSYSIPTREEDRRVRIIVPQTQLTESANILIGFDDGSETTLQWLPQAISQAPKKTTLTTSAVQQLKLTEAKAIDVAIAGFVLKSHINSFTVKLLANRNEAIDIGMQYQIPRQLVFQESEYLKEIAKLPNAIASWQTLLLKPTQYTEAIPDRLQSQWLPMALSINSAAKQYRHGLNNKRHRIKTAAISKQSEKDIWYRAQQSAKEQQLVKALIHLQPLINNSFASMHHKAQVQRLAWLEALGEYNIAERLRRQLILFSDSAEVRQILVTQSQQRLSSEARWGSLFNLYSALLIESLAQADKAAQKNDKALENLYLKAAYQWQSLLAQSYLRQNKNQNSLLLMLLLPSQQQSLETLVEAAFKNQWWQSFEHFHLQLDDAGQKFWSNLKTQWFYEDNNNQLLIDTEKNKQATIMWASTKKYLHATGQSHWLHSANNKQWFNALEMNNKSPIKLKMTGPALLRIAYRNFHSGEKMDETKDWLQLKDNNKTLHLPLFNSSQLANIAPLNVGLNKYFYYQLPAGEHHLQLNSLNKSWLLDIQLAQSSLCLNNDNVDLNNSCNILSENKLYPQPVDFLQVLDSPYKKAMHGLWQAEINHSPAQKLRAQLPEVSHAFNNANEATAVQNLLNRLDRSLSWKSLAYVQLSAGQLKQEIKHWQPETPAWKIRQLIGQPPDITGEVLLDHKALLIELNNLSAGEYRLQLQAHHLPQFILKPMQVEVKINQKKTENVVLSDTKTRVLRIKLNAGSQSIRIKNIDYGGGQFISARLQQKQANGQWLSLQQPSLRRYQIATASTPIDIEVKGPIRLRSHNQTLQELNYYYLGEGWHKLRFPHIKGGKHNQTLYRFFTEEEKQTEDATARSLTVSPLHRPATTNGKNDIAESLYTASAFATAHVNNSILISPPEQQIPGSLSVDIAAKQRRLLDEDENIDAERFIELGLKYRYHDAYRHQYWRSNIFWRTARNEGKDVLGLKQRWDWFPYRQSFSGGVAFDFYLQALEMPLTDISQDDWANSAQLKGYIANDHRFNPYLSHKVKASVFNRWLSLEDLPKALRPAVDQDVYSQYKNDHQHGLILSDRLNYSPWLDSQAYTSFSLNTNEDFNPFDADVYRLDLGWRQLVREVSFDLRYRMQRFSADEDRRESVYKPQVRLNMHWRNRTLQRYGWHTEFNYTFDQDSGNSAWGIGFSRSLDREDNYDAYRPDEIDFRALRQRLHYQNIAAE